MALKPSRELAVPFHIGADGGFAYVEDPYRQAIQRLTTLIMTRPGERVMEPLFGSEAQNYVFEPADDIVAAELVVKLGQAIKQWEPRLDVVDIIPERAPALEGSGLVITVLFRLPPDDTVHTTTVDLGGAFPEVLGG